MTAMLTHFKGDRTLWILILILMLCSLPLIYSATGQLAYRQYQGNTESALVAHAVKLGIGLGLILLVHRIPYGWWGKLASIGHYLAGALLVFTLFFGQNINEATRFVEIPVVRIRFQASDLARWLMILNLARGLTLLGDRIKTFRGGWDRLLAGLLIVCGLIAPENLSTAAMMLAVGLGMIAVAGARLRHLVALVAVVVLVFGSCLALASWLDLPLPGRAKVWAQRIGSFTAESSGEEDYQVVQAKIAVAQGGIWGKGPGKSIQRNFLPHAYSDYMYAIVIEEYGLLGGAMVLILYLGLFYRIRKCALRCATTFGSLLATGFGLAMMAQAMVNMAVSVNLMPVTGQTLPFISHGGSSILINALAIGIVLSISRDLTSEGDWSELDLQDHAAGKEVAYA